VTLVAEGLTKTYREHAAVWRADLTVAVMDFVVIVGRSGSGKSTLLGMLGALMTPSEGSVRLDGRDLSELGENDLAELRRSDFGFVFQFPSLLTNLSIVDNVALPGLLEPAAQPKDVYATATGLLRQVGLESRAHCFPAELSGGEQRRVAIARALVNGPRFLLADEPTGDLDADTEEEIIDLLTTLRRSNHFALVVVTHNLELATRADRAYVMSGGVLTPFTVPAAPASRSFARPAALPRPANDATAGETPRAEPRRLGADLSRLAGKTIAIVAVAFIAVIGVNAAVERYQAFQLQQQRDRLAELEQLATSTLRGDVASITRIGDHRFRVEIYLENTSGDRNPIYIMSPSVKAFVQVGLEWQELPLAPVGDATATVLKVTGRQTYGYEFDARVSKYTQLLPYYMHVRIKNDMVVSPESTPTDEIFNREDNYYVYLKPDGVDDATIAKRVKFPGPAPLWIWMPPH
jgi:ABC-type lipoprotein export system ATPase subunit